jgi:hypothetical protein
MEIQTQRLVSIGGGIDLSPQGFKIISRDVSSPRIRELTALRTTLRTDGKVARSADRVRSTVSDASPRTIMMPRFNWTVKS